MSQCSRCGAELEEGGLVCSKCGLKVEAAGAVTPPPPESSPPGTDQTRRGEYLKTGWHLFKQYPGGFIGFTALALLIEGGLGCLPKVGWLVVLIHYPLMFGFLAVSVRLMQRQTPHFSEFFHGFKFFLTLLLLGVVSQVFITLGLLLLIIPGIYLVVAYLLAPLFVLDQGVGFWRAMEMSRRTVQVRWFELFGLSLLILLINLGGLLLLGLGLLVTIPVSWCAITAAYAEMVGFKSARTPEATGAAVAPEMAGPLAPEEEQKPAEGFAERSLAKEIDWKPALTLIGFLVVVVLAGIYFWQGSQPSETKRSETKPAVEKKEPAPQLTAKDYFDKAYATKDPQEKIFFYTKAIDLDPDYTSAYNNRGNVYYDKKDYELALMDYNKAIAIRPDYAYAYNNRGRVYYYKKDYEQALQDYTKAIEFNPDYAYAYNNRGNVYYDKKEDGQAITDYSRAIELKPDYYTAYNNRGNTYYRQKDYQKAINDYTRAIDLKPDVSAYYCNRGNAYYYQGDYGKALPDYDKAIDLTPDYANAYYRRAILYNKTGNYEKARTDYDKAKTLNPNLPELKIPAGRPAGG